jgi:hypothetical protein
MAYEPHGDDAVFPVTGNEDLIATGLSSERDDDGCGPYSLFADDVGRGTTSINLDVNVAGAVAPATGTTVDSNTPTMTNNTGINGTTSTAVSGKHKSKCWVDFEEIYEMINGNQVRVQAIYKLCRTTLSARSAAGTGHILRHQKSCRKKLDHTARVQSRVAFNPDGSLHNWNYDPAVATTELCRLIARLDLSLGIGDTYAFEDYIVHAHNPRFVRSSRRATTRDLGKLFNERRDRIHNCVLPAASSVSLTSDIWSGNAKEDYISVVAHYVNAD